MLIKGHSTQLSLSLSLNDLISFNDLFIESHFKTKYNWRIQRRMAQGMAEEDAAVSAFAIDGENLDNIEGGFEFS